MTITLTEIDRWNPQTLDEVFDRCQRINNECIRLDDKLQDLSRLEGWGGESATAASSAIGKVRIDVGDLMVQSTHIRRAVDSAQSEVEAVKFRLEEARRLASINSLLISSEGKVTEDMPKRPPMTGWTVRAIENFADEKAQKIFEVQAEIDSILTAAADADADLAAAILGATGQINAPEMNRSQTARDAFRRTFNRDPESEADWKTASMLNRTSYDPKYKGVQAEIVVSRIQPVPGQGIVRLGLFIPSKTVFNFPSDDLGDNRGFDQNFGPEDTRATVYVDYENGVVITRQNPSVQTDGQVKVDAPSATTWQLPDGTVMVKYSATNAFAPPGSGIVDRVVRGSVILTPSSAGPELYGHIGDYPSAEAYSERSGEPTRTLLLDQADNTGPRGPMLELGSYHLVGEKPEGFDDLFEDKAGPGSRAVVPHPRVDGTPSGAASDPPTTVVVRER